MVVDQFFILLALAIAATFFVVAASVALILHKVSREGKTKQRKDLYDRSSQMLVEILLRELPPAKDDGTNAVFKQYDVLLEPIQKSLKTFSKSRKRMRRDVLKSVFIDLAQDISGESLDRLVYFSYSLGFVDDEIRRLQSPRWWIRAHAARDLGFLRARGAVPAITTALEDENLDVRNEAMASLITVVGVEALRTILRFTRNISGWTAIEISIIVMKFKEEAVPYLVEALGFDDQSVILFSIEMLAEIGFVSAVDALRGMARDYPNTPVRAKAVEALGRLGDSRAENLLFDLVRNPVPALRLKAIEAIGRIGLPNAIPLLMDRLREGGLTEKLLAARAIAAAGEEGLSVLHSQAEAENKMTRRVASQVLEEFENHTALAS